ncbi:MAG: glucuronate isomerase [Bacteroidales bacterium]|jgi:glucuronate isomerase
MNGFINEDFLLISDVAKELYHSSAEKMPIIDYHCHLIPKMISHNHMFNNLSEIWISGDHYKWRAMRGNGISESYITGNKPASEKFEKWAETIPYTMRNPLYHWSHLELFRIFGIDKLLSPATAKEIYEECSAKLQTEDFRVLSIMDRCRVEVVCTTDDPVDSLEYHREMKGKNTNLRMLPTWRPDKAMNVDNPLEYKKYIECLENVSGISIRSYAGLLDALKKRHDYFSDMGCKISDHGLETFYSQDFTESEITGIFNKIINNRSISLEEVQKFKSGILYDLAVMDYEKGWTQQFHIGAIRNNNTRMYNILGADTGYDAIHDIPCALAGHRFFDRLSMAGSLAKTIIYNLNPKDYEVLATMAYTFNDGTLAGKMQLGSGWWFLDQEEGIRRQLNTLSNFGLLSRFVGMLTDSRSFMSFPRHEYFRRILCNLLGEDIESGKLPKSEMEFIKKIVSDISYNNAKKYFDF